MKKVLLKIACFIPAFVWAVLITMLSILPASDFDGLLLVHIPHADLAVHFILYLILSFLLFPGMLHSGIHSKSGIISISFLIPFLWGVLMEVIQYTLIPSRSGSLTDLLFNTLGAAVGILLGKKIYRTLLDRFPKQNNGKLR